MSNASTPEWGTGWHWPVPDFLQGAGRFPAVVTSGFSANHRGADIFLSRQGTANGKPITVTGYDKPYQKAKDGVTSDVTKDARFFAPQGLWILAARAGKVRTVVPTVNGIWVELDHGPPWATAYGHLETVRVKVGDVVGAGEIIGTMGAGLNTDPKKGLVDHEHLRHLHFETWYKGPQSHAVDPSSEMQNFWKRSVWH